MLIPNETLWPSDRIFMVQNTSKWDDDSSVMTECVLKMIRARFEESSSDRGDAILIIDLGDGEFPPWGQVLQIVKFFITMQSLLISGLTCTVIHASTEGQKTWIGRVLSLYKPAKPVHVVENKAMIKDTVSEYRKQVQAPAV